MTKAETIRVQAYLQHSGLYNGKVDGIAGPMTMSGIRLFQRSYGLVEDGIAGPITLGTMFPDEPKPIELDLTKPFYLGKAKGIEKGDVERIALDIGVEPRVLKTVITVEANGKPYDTKNRVLALYEPHIAYRMAPDVHTRSLLVTAKIAWAKWNRSKYPKGMDARYAQIDKCSDVASEELAADSTSWGMGQIMGFNAKASGYMTAVDMVRSFAADAENQIAAMGAFILNNASLLQALKRKDWEAFAEGYNGAAYRKNNYHLKLASAYKAGG